MFCLKQNHPFLFMSDIFKNQLKNIKLNKHVSTDLSPQEKLDNLSQKIIENSLVTSPNKKSKKKHPLKVRPMKLKEDVIIQCKREEFNHHRNQLYDKFDTIPLASSGWNHYKSKGDYFIINFQNSMSRSLSKINLGTFEDTGLNPEITKILREHELDIPTEIQKLGIPTILNGSNSILVAETGSGKTLSFLAPLVQQVLSWKSQATYQDEMDAPLALVITPGRELVFQIGEVAEWFKNLGVRIKVLSGVDMKRKIYSEPEHIDIMVSSIGALSKMTTAGKLKTRNVQHVILDEADTLLDDSFNDKLVHYLNRMKMRSTSHNEENSKAIQLTLIGATMPTSIEEILGEVIDLSTIEKITTSKAHKLLPHIPQKFMRIGPNEKPIELLKIAKRDVAHNIPLIVFSNRTSTCDWLSMFINENGVDCVNLNGDMLSEIRKDQLSKFQQGIVNVMSCTDVASRGLDTLRAKHILNYDFPYYISDYIHRCGRTGRQSPHGFTKGTVTNFISNNPREIELVQKIEKSIRTQEQELPNINANIRKIIHFRYLKKQDQIQEKERKKIENEPSVLESYSEFK